MQIVGLRQLAQLSSIGNTQDLGDDRRVFFLDHRASASKSAVRWGDRSVWIDVGTRACQNRQWNRLGNGDFAKCLGQPSDADRRGRVLLPERIGSKGRIWRSLFGKRPAMNHASDVTVIGDQLFDDLGVIRLLIGANAESIACRRSELSAR